MIRRKKANLALREHYGIEVDTKKPLEFHELIGLKVQEEGFFGDYKKNRTNYLREKEPEAKKLFY